MNLPNILKNRRTIRVYQRKPIKRSILEKIVEAGSWAPSAHNTQPWEFLIIRTSNEKKSFSKYLKKNYRKYNSSVNILLKESVKIIENAPVIILALNSQIFSRRLKKFGGKYYLPAYIAEIQSISAAIQNMNLCAYYLGLGMAWLTTPIFLKDGIMKYFRNKAELVAILTLGYSKENGYKFKRKEISKTVRYI